MTDLISVIITTYNRPDALSAVLRSLSRQSDRNFEIIVADDGSTAETARVISAWAAKMPVRIEHVWHPDQGFRAAEIRNRAVHYSKGHYCIFLDGDCIARPDFVATHRGLAEPSWFVTGNRILISRELTNRILHDGLEPEQWGFTNWIMRRARLQVNRFTPLIDIHLGFLRKIRSRQWRGARSCNMALWRSDFEAVDGFDAAFSGWGREDSDIFIRLIRSGARRKDGNFATGVLHLWHQEADRSKLEENDRQIKELLEIGRVRARIGLSQLTGVKSRGPHYEKLSHIS